MRTIWRVATMAGVITMTGALAAAQSTQFNQGPQYLLPSPQAGALAQPIATPTMSLNGTNPTLQVGASNATNGNLAGADLETASTSTSGQNVVDLFSVYYGYRPVFMVSSAAVEEEESEGEPARTLLSGIGRNVRAGDLHFYGYGVPLGDAAREAKAHRRTAKRAFTNADLQHKTAQ